MTVPARPAASTPSAANPELVVVRADRAVRAGTYPYDATDVTTSWHHHELHQVEYAIEGSAQVETATARYLLPPQRAVWIPAGLAHRTTLKRVRTVSLFLDPAMVPGRGDRARVLSVTGLCREMLAYGARWPIDRPSSDAISDSYFRTLALLVTQWLDDEVPLHLPTSTDPIVAAAMSYTDAHLHATLREVCAAVAVSERTLRRRFADGPGITWRTYRLHSRLLSAMSLLTQPRSTVFGVAAKVGFDSASAFTRSFTAYTGESPSSYRSRILTR